MARSFASLKRKKGCLVCLGQAWTCQDFSNIIQRSFVGGHGVLNTSEQTASFWLQTANTESQTLWWERLPIDSQMATLVGLKGRTVQWWHCAMRVLTQQQPLELVPSWSPDSCLLLQELTCGAGEWTHSAKCMLGRREELSSVPRSVEVAHACNPRVERQRWELPVSQWASSLMRDSDF